jgi:hypothetical protein
MATLIEERCQRFLSEGRAPTDVSAVATAYEARGLTARLAETFDGILGGPVGRPRSLVSTAW